MERLRPNGWRRLVAIFGSPRDVFSRPLAFGLTTLGLAGLLVATVPGVLFGPGGATATFSSVGESVGGADANPETVGAPRAAAAPSAAPSAGQSFGPALLAPAAGPSAAPAPVAPSGASPSGGTYDSLVVGPDASSGAAAVAPESSSEQREAYGATAAKSTAEVSVERSEVMVVASLLLIVGLGLFALRWTSRRLGDG